MRRARLPSAPDRTGGRRRRELAGKGVFACERPERGRDLPPSRDSELLAQDVAVRLGRPRGDAESLPDLFVRAAPCDQLDHLALPVREREVRVVPGARHGRGRYVVRPAPTIGRREYSAGLDARRAEAAADETCLVAARIGLIELVLRQGADPEQKI